MVPPLSLTQTISHIASYRTKTGPLRSPGSSYPVRGLWEFWNGNFVVTVEELVEYLVADCLIGIHGVSYVGVRNDLYLMSNDLLRHTPISF